VTSRVHHEAGVAYEEGPDHDGEEEHVPGESEEDKEAYAAKQLPGTAILIIEIVVTTPTTSSPGGSSRNGRLAASSGLLAFDPRGCWGED
jgi:hypothetical protein